MAAALAGIAVAACLLAWAIYMYPFLTRQRAMTATMAPLLNEARSLKITYESVLAFPYQTIGKPAVWCIQKPEQGRIYYRGDMNKKIMEDSPGEIPLFVGGKHSACTDMLVIIKGVKTNTVGGYKAAFVSIQFVSQI